MCTRPEKLFTLTEVLRIKTERETKKTGLRNRERCVIIHRGRNLLTLSRRSCLAAVNNREQVKWPGSRETSILPHKIRFISRAVKLNTGKLISNLYLFLVRYWENHFKRWHGIWRGFSFVFPKPATVNPSNSLSRLKLIHFHTHREFSD